MVNKTNLNDLTPKFNQTKEAELEIVEVQADSVIVRVDGWRIRVYLDNKEIAEKLYVGKVVKVGYTGNINDVHSLIFDKLK